MSDEDELNFDTKLIHHARYWYVKVPTELVAAVKKMANSSKILSVKLSKRGEKHRR